MNSKRKCTISKKQALGLAATILITGNVQNNVFAQEITSNIESKMDLSKKRSVVTVTLNKEIKEDISYRKDAVNPSIIIVDLNEADKTFTSPTVVQNDPIIKNMYVRIIDDKVKLVIETKFLSKVKAIKQDKRAILIIEQDESLKNKKVDTTGLSDNWTQIKTTRTNDSNPGVVAGFNEVININAKKEGLRSTKITLNFSEKINTPVFKKEDGSLVLDLKNVAIPNELQRRISLDNLGTNTKNIDVSMQKGNAKIVIEQKDNWEYSFYQLDKQLVIQMKATDKKDDEKKYIGKPLSISFQDMDVRAILQVIADFTGLNIMSSDKVSGTMTIRLKDVPWDQALDLVLESRGLQKVTDGNVVWVATSEEVTANNKAKLELKNQTTELEPLKLEFFQINYYKADDLRGVLEGKADQTGNAPIRLLSKRGTVGVDPRNNMIFVQDTEQNLKEVRKLVKKLDIANKQVLIEAKIVIADDSFGRDLGSRFGIKYRSQSGDTSVGIGGNITESGSQASGSTTVTPLTNLASTGLNAVSPGVIGLTLLNMATGDALGLELSALEQNNRGKVVSNPRLLTADNKKAIIEQGTEIPYVTPGTASSPPTITFKKAVLKLEVTPQIAPNGKVVMDLSIRKDTIGQLIPIQGGGQIPSIDTKNIDTLVTVNNGQTVVLGGVYEITNRDDLSKIPFLGDLPFLGNLFKHTTKSEKKGELMIFITPYVIEEKDLDDGAPQEKPPEINLSKN